MKRLMYRGDIQVDFTFTISVRMGNVGAREPGALTIKNIRPTFYCLSHAVRPL